MKFFAVFALVVASAIAADVQQQVYLSPDYNVPIVRSESSASPDGSSYSHVFETGNGIYEQAEGIVRSINAEEVANEVKGEVRYTAPDGTPVRLTYVANENGYQPAGDHLPVGPEIPELILRSLQYIADHPAAPEYVSKV